MKIGKINPTKSVLLLVVLILTVSLVSTAWIPSQSALANGNTVTYTYDDAGRLTGVEYPNGATIDYDYDNAGNLLERIVAIASASFDDLINTLTQFLAGFASFDDLINMLTLYLASD